MSTQFSQRLRKLVESNPAMIRDSLMHVIVQELERAGEMESPDLWVISELFNALLSTQKRSLELYQKERTHIRLDKDGRVDLTPVMGESITIAAEAIKELGAVTAIANKAMAALTKALEPITQAAVKPETYTIPNYGPSPFLEYYNQWTTR